MLACYVRTLSDLNVWCLTLAIHEMTAINEITAKMDHVPFTCNWFIVLRKWAHRRMLLQKRCSENISKFQQILATAMKSISRKGSFLKLVNVLWKRTLPQLFFYIATLISSKLWKFPVHSLIRRDFSFSAFPFIDQEKFFLFLWLFLMKDAVVEHSHIMWESDASDLFKKLLNMSGKYINNSFH